jgi:adenine-specific DNA-methyltransferase
VQAGMVSKSIWPYDEVGHNQVSRREIMKLFGELVFATPKPEKLLKRIIELATSEGELVLDFFLGSGTTTAVAHKMKRKYIGIDQMDYIRDVAVVRMQKVIAGERGGVSIELNWRGGGDFKYMEQTDTVFENDNAGNDGKIPDEQQVKLNREFYLGGDF